jgi:ADP-ribose pyrophosphatase
MTDVLAEGQHLRLVRRDRWEYAERIRGTGIVVIVAVTDDGRLLLTEQHRIPVGRPVIELPAGLAGDRAEDAGEDLETAARRELLEETGYEAEAFERLTEGPPSAGLSSEVVTFLRATRPRKVGAGGGDAHEAITVHAVPLGEVPGWLDAVVRRGCLVDPKVYAGLYFAALGLAAEPRGELDRRGDA